MAAGEQADADGETAGGTEHPYVRAWGGLMGSYPTLVDQALLRAKMTNAPPEAVYELRDHAGAATGEWATVDQVSPGNRELLERLVRRTERAAAQPRSPWWRWRNQRRSL